jgi:hypothetical protein
LTTGGSSLRGTALAFLAAAASLLVQAQCARDPRLVYSRFDLPAFDAYVYVAMAEEPRVFTVAPWGYRLLTPALAHAAAGGDPARVLRGFRIVNHAALLGAAVLLWSLARRLGLAPWAALSAVPLFVLSPPVAELLRNPFLADAATVALATALLLSLERGARWPVVALLAMLGALAKESFLLLLPVAYLARRRDGERNAILTAAVAVAAAVAVTVLLRAWWTPHLDTPVPAAALDTVRAALGNVHVFAVRQRWAVGALLAVAAAALAASRRAEGRSLLARYGWVALAALFAPFFNPVVFSPGDVRRLLIHALPVLVLVVLAALPRAWGAPPPFPSPAVARHASLLAGVTAAAVLLSPLALDRYRRADLQGPRDGPYVLAFCRETLRTARRLQRGDRVTLDPAEREFQWGVSDPGRLDRMRWFLRAGWGPLPHYSTGEPEVRAARAELIVPAPAPRPLDLHLHLDAGGPAGGTLLVNGRAVGPWRAPGEGSWRLPPEVLFRGDNVVTLEDVPDAAGVRLRRLTLAPAAP